MNETSAKVFLSFYAEPGQNFRIVGNTLCTGNWDPILAQPLCESDTCYTATLTLPLNTTLEYKYLKFSDPPIWEPFSNRKLRCNSSIIYLKDYQTSQISHISHHSDLPKPEHQEKLPQIKESIHFSLSDSVIFANFNLPVKVERNPEYSDNNTCERWLVEKNKGLWLPVLFDLTVSQDLDILWVGWPGIVLESEEEERSLTDFLLQRYKCLPVFLSKQMLDDFSYFCSEVLFPVLNNIVRINARDCPQYGMQQWEVYKSVNSIFAEAIMNNYRSQLIWINDYSLMLTPNFVSRRIHELLNIGFYFQSPFPSADVFKVLPQSESMLHSILACDLVSFHSYDYASDFLKTCKLLISVDHHFSKEGYLLIEYFGRHIMVRVGDIGIVPENVPLIMATDEFEELRKVFKARFQDTQVILGIDSPHELSGLAIKLEAFYRFIKATNSNFVLVQYLTKAKLTFTKGVNKVIDELMRIQEKANAKLGRKAIQLISEELTPIQRYAIMSEAYALINTSLKESMFLVPYEFLIVNKGKDKPIIVSEFTGVSRSLRSFVRINPFYINNICDALANMRVTDFYKCRAYDVNLVTTKTMQKWATSFLGDLKKAQKDPRSKQYLKHGMGDRMKLVALKKNFSKLDLESLLITYKRAHYRAMFFDNEGTLVEPISSKSALNLHCNPKTKMLECLSDLAKDPQNVVFIVTGREKKVLQAAYNIPHLGLAAEYGAFIKWNSSENWESRCAINDMWMDTSKHIIQSYVNRTDGSYLEVKECSVVFQYYNCDYDYSSWQAKELVAQLDMLLNPYVDECEVVEGTGYVEVKPRLINKGCTIEYVMEQCHEAGATFDFVLAIGDGSSDEEMFRTLKNLSCSKNKCLSENARCFSCTLGKKPTDADYYLNDSSEILHYLETLRNWTKREPDMFNNWNTNMHIVDVLNSHKHSEKHLL